MRLWILGTFRTLNVTGGETKKNVLIEGMLKTYEEKISLRKKCNFLLDNVVNLNTSLYPELRYIQNLWVLGIIDACDSYNEFTLYQIITDRYSEEPYDTVVRILPKIVDLISTKFPEKSKITDRIKRANIFTCLEELGLAKKTEDFKLEICS